MRAHTLTIFLATLLLVGCGQKGPLFLPAEPEQAPVAAQPAEPLEQDQQKSK